MTPRQTTAGYHMILVLTLGLALATAGAARADTVKLENGDILTGTVTNFSSGTLTLSTKWGGTLSINSSYIVALSTEKPFVIRWKDGSERVARLGISASGEIEILPPEPEVPPDDAATTQTAKASTSPAGKDEEPAPAEEKNPALDWEIDQAKQATLAAEKTTSESDASKPIDSSLHDLKLSDVKSIDPLTPYLRYKGDLNFGFSRVRGNSNTSDLNFDGQIEPSIGRNTFILYGQVVRSFADEALTESTWRLNLSYNRFFGANDRWYANIGNRYYSDEFADLDLRVTAGAGIGYKFFTAKPTIFSASIGPSYTNERYSGDQADVQYGGLSVDYNFEQDIWNTGLSLYSKGDFTTGLTRKEFVLNTTSGIKMPVIRQITLSAEVQWTYNMEPAEDATPSDETYTLKLGYNFGGDQDDWFKGW